MQAQITAEFEKLVALGYFVAVSNLPKEEQEELRNSPVLFYLSLDPSFKSDSLHTKVIQQLLSGFLLLQVQLTGLPHRKGQWTIRFCSGQAVLRFYLYLYGKKTRHAPPPLIIRDFKRAQNLTKESLKEVFHSSRKTLSLLISKAAKLYDRTGLSSGLIGQLWDMVCQATLFCQGSYETEVPQKKWNLFLDTYYVLFGVCLWASHPVLIGCYNSCDIRIFETLICLESSHWLNLMWHHSIVSRPNASTSLVTSVNASMASTKELPKCALKIIPDTD